MGNPEIDNIVTGPGEGETIRDTPERGSEVLTEREDISVTALRHAAGERGAGPHVHREHSDSFYVLDGEVTFRLGPDLEPVVLGPGGFIGIPPNVIHAFDNDGDVESRILTIHTPDGGFAEYMRAVRDGREFAWDSFDPPQDGGRAAGGAIASPPGAGERLVAANRVVLLKGEHPHLSCFEWEIDGPFSGPDVHAHDDQVDSFYVLEGELEMTVEDAAVPAGPGTLASVPRGVRHTFHHRGAGTARALNLHAPDAGFADFMRSISD